MIDLMEEIASAPCACCGNPIGHTHVNLSYNEERVSESEVEVSNSVVLKSYCTAMECDAGAARKELSALGVTHHDDDDPTLCSTCGKTHIDLSAWHAAFTITLDEFDGDSFHTLEDSMVVVGCLGCEALKMTRQLTA